MPDLKRRIIDCQVRKAKGERALTFTASTDQVARDEEIIEVKAWDTSEWERNPVVLWSHNPFAPPIGKGLPPVRKILRGKNKRIEVDVEFAGLEQMSELAEQVYLLYQADFLRAVSVGYSVLESREPTEEEAKRGARRVVTKAMLYEISAVTVPADTDALIQNSDTPEEIREAALAVRAAQKDTQPSDTASTALGWIQPFREIVVHECETLGATLFERITAEFDLKFADLEETLCRVPREEPERSVTAEAKTHGDGEAESEHSDEDAFRELASEYLKSKPDNEEDFE